MANEAFATFKAWVRDTLVDGTLPFTAPIWDGTDYVTKTCQFTEPYQSDAGAGFMVTVSLIRDGSRKRSTGCRPDHLGGVEQALQEYLAKKHKPKKRNGDPAEVLIADVLNLFSRDNRAGLCAPEGNGLSDKAAAELVGRTGRRKFAARGERPRRRGPNRSRLRRPHLNLQGLCAWVGKQRTASIDLELLRAAIKHANKEQLLDREVPVTLPPKSMPRERWLTRDEVAHLMWLAWRKRRLQDGEPDEYASGQHLARWMIMAYYTGTRRPRS